MKGRNSHSYSNNNNKSCNATTVTVQKQYWQENKVKQKNQNNKILSITTNLFCCHIVRFVQTLQSAKVFRRRRGRGRGRRDRVYVSTEAQWGKFIIKLDWLKTRRLQNKFMAWFPNKKLRSLILNESYTTIYSDKTYRLHSRGAFSLILNRLSMTFLSINFRPRKFFINFRRSWIF